MGGRDAPLRRERDARPASRSRDRPSARRCAGARGRGGAPQGAGGRRRAVSRCARGFHRTERCGISRRAGSVSGARHRSPDAEERRGARSPETAAARARPAGAGAARPRRPAPRQHRADRRPSGAVRCPRIRSAGRSGRRALRPRIPAHGPDRARLAAGGEYGAQSISRRNTADIGPRRPRGTASVHVGARRDPCQGDGGTPGCRTGPARCASPRRRAPISVFPAA